MYRGSSFRPELAEGVAFARDVFIGLGSAIGSTAIYKATAYLSAEEVHSRPELTLFKNDQFIDEQPNEPRLPIAREDIHLRAA